MSTITLAEHVVNNILVTNDPDLDHIDEEIFNALHGKSYRQLEKMLSNRDTIEDISFVPDPGEPTIRKNICPDTVDRLMPFIPFYHGVQTFFGPPRFVGEVDMRTMNRSQYNGYIRFEYDEANPTTYDHTTAMDIYNLRHPGNIGMPTNVGPRITTFRFTQPRGNNTAHDDLPTEPIDTAATTKSIAEVPSPHIIHTTKVENMSLRDVEEFLSLEMDPSEPTHHIINSTSTDLNTPPLQHPFVRIDDHPKCIFLEGGTSHGRTEGMVFIDRTLHVRVFQLALMIEASSDTAHDSAVNTNPIWFDDVPFINNSFDLSNAKIGFGNKSLQYDRGTDDDNGERFRYDIITITYTWGEKQKNTEGDTNIGRIINSGVCAFAEEESHYSDTAGGRLWRERWKWGATSAAPNSPQPTVATDLLLLQLLRYHDRFCLLADNLHAFDSSTSLWGDNRCDPMYTDEMSSIATIRLCNGKQHGNSDTSGLWGAVVYIVYGPAFGWGATGNVPIRWGAAAIGSTVSHVYVKLFQDRSKEFILELLAILLIGEC